jgi:hypothetical protein
MNAQETIVRRLTMRRALEELRREKRIDFGKLFLQVRQEQPGISRNAVRRKAKWRLKLQNANRFKEIYKQERELVKKELGIVDDQD